MSISCILVSLNLPYLTIIFSPNLLRNRSKINLAYLAFTPSSSIASLSLACWESPTFPTIVAVTPTFLAKKQLTSTSMTNKKTEIITIATMIPIPSPAADSLEIPVPAKMVKRFAELSDKW